MKYLKKFKINEGASNSYRISIMPDVEYYGIFLDGKEVDEITCNEIIVNFDIEIDSREWGIKDISVFNFKGPSELNLNVRFYPDDNVDSDTIDTEVIVPLNWENAIKEISDEKGGITIEQVKIELINEESGMVASPTGDIRSSGKIIVSKIIIITNEI